ncbi:hypothetical protein ACJX0J_023754, partial [Zea mays]
LQVATEREFLVGATEEISTFTDCLSLSNKYLKGFGQEVGPTFDQLLSKYINKKKDAILNDIYIKKASDLHREENGALTIEPINLFINSFTLLPYDTTIQH